MFERLTLNHTYRDVDYTHIDLSVDWLRGTKLHPKLRFKFFIAQDVPGLEFRNFSDWPKVFASWPGQDDDQHGPYFRISAADDGDTVELDSESIVTLSDIGAHITSIITALADDYTGEITDKPGLVRQARVLSDGLSRKLAVKPFKPVESQTADGVPVPTAASVPAIPRPAAIASVASAPAGSRPAAIAGAEAKPAAPQVGPRPSPDTIPDYVRTVIEEFNTVRLEPVTRSARPMPDCWTPIVISVVKNEFDRLFDFLRHYRAAGIERFVFIDNGSTDGTREFLASQPDVDLYARHGRFDWKLKQGWINRAVRMYGLNRWYIYVDADEHLVFDGIGERSFRDLARVMESRRVFRVRGFLVDMYADGPLLQSDYAAHGRLLDAYPFCDLDSYIEAKYKEVISVKGGPRTRVFGKADAKFRPEMTKYPLFKITADEFMANPHHIWPYDGNFNSDRYIGVLHFKFLPSIVKRIRQAIADENYWDGSFEYKCYLKILDGDRDLSLIYGSSGRVNAETDLLSMKLIAPVGWDDAPAGSMTTAYLRHRAKFSGQDGLSRFEMATDGGARTASSSGAT